MDNMAFFPLVGRHIDKERNRNGDSAENRLATQVHKAVEDVYRSVFYSVLSGISSRFRGNDRQLNKALRASLIALGERPIKPDRIAVGIFYFEFHTLETMRRLETIGTPVDDWSRWFTRVAEIIASPLSMPQNIVGNVIVSIDYERSFVHDSYRKYASRLENTDVLQQQTEIVLKMAYNEGSSFLANMTANPTRLRPLADEILKTCTAQV